MNVFVLPSFAQTTTLLGTLVLLTSCSYYRKQSVDTPPKVFQYSYENPSRKLIPANFSRKLSTGKLGEKVVVHMANGQSATIRLGENYFSANGNPCRRYTKASSILMSACKINNRWYQSQPILANQ